MREIAIRMLQDSDLQGVTDIHLAAFPKSALGQLGNEAVTSYYEWQLHGPHDAVAYGIYLDETLVGFCFAGVFKGALSGFLQKNRNFLIWRLLTHPSLLAAPFFRERLKLAWALLTRRPVPTVSQPSIPEKSFGVLAIAVDPQMQGAGYGKLLMMEVEKTALQLGFVHLHLTVAENNFQSIDFYERMGWHKVSIGDKAWHGLMMKNLATS